jgi:uncharacterized membrane protein
MCQIMAFMTLSKVGLILNLIGTVMVAFSFGKNPEEAHTEDEKGNKIYLASYLSPKLFKAGLALIFAGFLLQLLDCK